MGEGSRDRRSVYNVGMTQDSDYGVPIPGKILPEGEWARTAIKKLPPPGALDFPGIFGRVSPLVIDLGCGNGRFLISSALARPECDHIGLEILPVVIRYATRRANQRGLTNARLIVCGGREFLSDYVGAGAVSEIHLYHPQPHTDRQPSGHRLITPEFLGLAHRALREGGLLVVQTDNLPYWRYWQEVLPALFEFREHPEPWPDAPRGRTRREIYARAHGLKVYRGLAARLPLPEAEVAARVGAMRSPDFNSRAGRR